MKAIVCLFATLFCMATQAGPVAYKVERVVYPRSDSYGDDLNGLGQPLAQVGISATVLQEKSVPLPSREEFSPLILIGTEGVTSQASLYEFEKRCEFLCGDEAEECHHTALINYNGQAIGTPLLALVGLAGEISGFQKIEPGDTDPTAEFSIPETTLVWPPDNFLALDFGGGKVNFSAGKTGKGAYSYDAGAPDCKLISYTNTGFSRLSCNGLEFLLHEQQPLLMSYADYNISSVQVLNTFQVNGQAYYTVLLALKAYTAYGILTLDETGWRFIVKPADWAQLC